VLLVMSPLSLSLSLWAYYYIFSLAFTN